MIDLILACIVLLVFVVLVRKHVRMNNEDIEQNARIARFSDVFVYNPNDE